MFMERSRPPSAKPSADAEALKLRRLRLSAVAEMLCHVNCPRPVMCERWLVSGVSAPSFVQPRIDGLGRCLPLPGRYTRPTRYTPSKPSS
jgi:hypothetical protein